MATGRRTRPDSRYRPAEDADDFWRTLEKLRHLHPRYRRAADWPGFEPAGEAPSLVAVQSALEEALSSRFEGEPWGAPLPDSL
ncbi:hypothetical protein [Candidatus Palauibacter sp.]|uniref:hypothetical protein n=1 Tax=Candidatus Palauibacter sp. TaxID=3101350 RepID=UPI003B519DFD